MNASWLANLTRVARMSAISAGVAVAMLYSMRSASGCGGTICQVTLDCARTMVMAKAVPGLVIIPAGAGTVTVPINVTVFVRCGNNCGGECLAPPFPVSATANIQLFGAACAPCTGSVSTAAGTMPLPGCSNAGVFTSFTIPVTIPAVAGFYFVVGSTTVTYSDGMVLTALGDTVVCVVDEAPDQPGVARLDMELLTPAFPTCAPGDQIGAVYRLTNNDPKESAKLTLTGTSKQVAFRPEGGDESMGVYAIANAGEDDFVIAFDADPDKECIALPPHPYIQEPITKEITLAPGEIREVLIGMRPWGQCSAGSCSESTLSVIGTFSDGSEALACGGFALYVANVETQNWGSEVNDCNNNGVYDYLDILNGTSVDENGNGTPDECETCIGDIDFNGFVDTKDLLFLLGSWGAGRGDPADLDEDGDVDGRDLILLLGAWGPCP